MRRLPLPASAQPSPTCTDFQVGSHAKTLQKTHSKTLLKTHAKTLLKTAGMEMAVEETEVEETVVAVMAEAVMEAVATEVAVMSWRLPFAFSRRARTSLRGRG